MSWTKRAMEITPDGRLVWRKELGIKKKNKKNLQGGKKAKMDDRNKRYQYTHRNDSSGNSPTIDIGSLCTHCGKDTAFKSGANEEPPALFLNRIPSDADAKVVYYGSINDPDSRTQLILMSGEEDVEVDITECTVKAQTFFELRRHWYEADQADSESREVSVEVTGYMCMNCQSLPCDACGKLELDYLISDEGYVTCEQCTAKEEANNGIQTI